MIKFSLIIISYQAPSALAKCLKSIESEKLDSTETIIVDNNSTNSQTQKLLQVYRQKPGFRVIFNSTNIGFGQANNQAAGRALGQWLIFINNDTFWPAGQLKKFCLELDKIPAEIIAVGPKILSPNGQIQFSAGHQPKPINLITWAWGLDIVLGRLGLNYQAYHLRNPQVYEKEFQPGWLAGTFLAVRKKDFIKVAGFPKNIFMYGEDVILASKLDKIGRLMYTPKIAIYHLGQASGSKEKSFLGEAIFLINFFKKHYGFWSRLYGLTVISLGFCFRIIANLLLGRPRMAFSYWRITTKVLFGK